MPPLAAHILKAPGFAGGLLPKPPADERDYALRSLRTPVESGTQGEDSPDATDPPPDIPAPPRGTRIDQAPVRGALPALKPATLPAAKPGTGLLLQPGVARDLPRPDKEVPPMRRFLVLLAMAGSVSAAAVAAAQSGRAGASGAQAVPPAPRDIVDLVDRGAVEIRTAGNGIDSGVTGPRGGTRP